MGLTDVFVSGRAAQDASAARASSATASHAHPSSQGDAFRDENLELLRAMTDECVAIKKEQEEFYQRLVEVETQAQRREWQHSRARALRTQRREERG